MKKMIPEPRPGDTIPQVNITFCFIVGAFIGLVLVVLLWS